MPDQIQPSMSRGELAEGLQGRIDTALYQVALKTAKNVVVHSTGGASVRPGLRYVAPVKDHSYPPRLIPFKFKRGDEYALEFGDRYVRFIREDNHVTEAAKSITNTSKSSPCTITTAGNHGFENGDEVYISGIRSMNGLNGRRFIVANKTNRTFQITNQVDKTNIDSSVFSGTPLGGSVAKVYEIASPYSIAEVDDITYSQTADIITLAHRNHPVQELTRLAHNNWTMARMFFGTNTGRPNAVTVKAEQTGSTTVAYKVTATDAETGQESLAGIWSHIGTISNISRANPAIVTTSSAHNFPSSGTVHIYNLPSMPEINGRDFTAEKVNDTTLRLVGEDSTGYTAYSSGGTVALTRVEITNSKDPTDNTISWAAVPNASKYSVYRESNGIFGLIGDSGTTSFRDIKKSIDLTIAPPEFTDIFRKTGDYPAAIGSYQQRQVFGGSNNKPDTSHFSQVGNRNNMNVSTPTQDNDAITASLPSDSLIEIKHYVSAQDLLVFGANGEFNINSGSDAAFTFSSINQKEQTTWGCSRIRPLRIGNRTIFVPEDQETVRDLQFNLDIEGYKGGDLSLFAKHLLRGNAVQDWCFARTPDPRVYMVGAKGNVVTLTLQDDQSVVAWTWWQTQGDFQKTTVSLRPHASDKKAQAYFVVWRKIGGKDVRYIERTTEYEFGSVEEAQLLDCSLTYDNRIGLSNIEIGETTKIHTRDDHGLANGDQVRVFGVKWEGEVNPDQLNRHRYYVAGVTAKTFRIVNSKGADINTEGFSPYHSHGSVGKCVTTIHGLSHLEGHDVTVLADGAVQEGVRVTNGAITLAHPASIVQIGLGYTADIETLDITQKNPRGGVLEGEKKNVSEVTLKLLRSRGVNVGPDENKLREIKDRGPQDYNRVQDVFSGVKSINIPQQWNSNGRVLIRQKYPLPMTVLYIAPTVDLERAY